MRRWNGWGDDSVHKELPPGAQDMLKTLVGPAKPQTSASLRDVKDLVPKSRLPKHPLISQKAEDRICHSRGQSLPDWVAWRSGRIDSFPDGVAFPETDVEVEQLIKLAAKVGAVVIPYGGGTSVVGHLTPPQSDRPVLTISLARLNQLRALDEKSHLATFGAGIAGPDLEAALRAKGYTLGHYPQSFEYATLGGWVVTRSSGQQSLGYGRIEDLFAGGKMITPHGTLELPNLPASAAGPDLRQLVMGSEGRMGILTEATVRIRRMPETERFHACFLPNWDKAEAAVRQLSQAKLPLSMMRLSNAGETQTNLILAGKDKLVKRLKQFLELRKVREDGCMLLLGFTGDNAIVKTARKRALSIVKEHRGVHMFQALGKAWKKNRFRAPYLRNSLWDLGYAVDTLETAVTWDRVGKTMNDIESALAGALEAWDERVHVFTHLSHFYTSGASIYTTYVFRIADTPEETLARWHSLKGRACQAIVDNGGTISHQHGVGLDHAPYLPHEKKPLGMRTLKRIFDDIDPEHIMNPGKLLLD